MQSVIGDEIRAIRCGVGTEPLAARECNRKGHAVQNLVRTTATQLPGLVASTFGIRIGVEEPAYSAQPLSNGVQIRRYGPRIAAQTTVVANEEAARNAGFRRLAGYIFGANHHGDQNATPAPADQRATGSGGLKIAMTAPVGQQCGDEHGWVIRFYMPTEWSLQSLPVPDDVRVELVALEPETVAVLRFSGNRGPDGIAEQTRRLRHELREYGFVAVGEPTVWFYDPPWTLPCLRRNEIAIPVEN